jgi:hypothetical protein
MLPLSDAKPGRIGKVRKVPLTDLDEESELSIVPLAHPPIVEPATGNSNSVRLGIADSFPGGCGISSARAFVELDSAIARYDAAISSLIKFSETL